MKLKDFKKGDIIELVEDGCGNAKIGATATIYRIDDSFIHITWERNALSNTQCDGGYFPNRFELLKRTWRQRYGKT